MAAVHGFESMRKYALALKNGGGAGPQRGIDCQELHVLASQNLAGLIEG
jgi:hypothetical protein